MEIINKVKRIFNSEEKETAQEVEERLMKVVRKLYTELEQKKGEIVKLNSDVRSLKDIAFTKEDTPTSCWRCGTRYDGFDSD